MLKYIILMLAASVASANAECASGYSQVTVPLCQLNPPTCGLTTTANNTMAIQAPCTLQLVTQPQNALVPIGLTDANATVAAASIPVQVTAPGMHNVEVWTHGAMAARLTQVGSTTVWTGNLNLSSEPAGPIHVVYNAWDVAPGGTPTINLQGEITLFVAGTRPAIPTPAPASGMTLAFSDHFTSLSAAPCKPGTGTWPSCTPPTASDGFKWYENLWNGQDFGDCANEHTDGSHNPFTILPQGGLRIRNTYDPAYNDPYGFSRTQYCGVLSSGFTDGTTSMPVQGDGYYDARVLIPNGSCGGVNGIGNGTCSGGTWPSFWMLSLNGSGTFEDDMAEWYGNDVKYLQQFTHAYPPAFFPTSPNGGVSTYPTNTDITWDFHTVGMKITGSGTSTGQICSYFDEVQQGCSSIQQFGSPNQSVTPKWSVMLELASGGGWVENAPPSNQYDMFVDWVGVWH